MWERIVLVTQTNKLSNSAAQVRYLKHCQTTRRSPLITMYIMGPRRKAIHETYVSERTLILAKWLQKSLPSDRRDKKIWFITETQMVVVRVSCPSRERGCGEGETHPRSGELSIMRPVSHISHDSNWSRCFMMISHHVDKYKTRQSKSDNLSF